MPFRRTSRWTLRAAAAAAAALLALGSVSACDITYADLDPGATADQTTGSGSDSGDAGARLKKLAVAKAASMKGYSRERFPHWRTAGANCDVRDTVLKRDGTNVKVKGCNVTSGTWTSAYDGKVFADPALVDIDHMVPLANAWRSGAATWTDDKRSDFANDLEEPQLIAVSANSNRSKGDQDPSTWKPKLTKSWCQYAQDWIAVKSHWKLSVTTKEKAALTDMLRTC